MIKGNAYKVLLAFIVALAVILTGCTSKAAAEDDKYASLDQARNVMVINDSAAKEAEKLKEEEIRKDISQVLYIAKLGFMEYKSAHRSEIWIDNKPSYYRVNFEGTDGKYYTIVSKDSKLQLIELPRVLYDDSHLEPLFKEIDENRINDYMDYATTDWLAVERKPHKANYTVIGHELVGDGKGNRTLVVYTQEGIKYTFEEDREEGSIGFGNEDFQVEEYLANLGKPKVAPEQVSDIIAAAMTGTVVKYKEGKINEDQVDDYAVLVRNDQDTSSGRIVVIDGNNSTILAGTDVVLGNDTSELELWDATALNSRFIYFFTHDGQPYNYLLHYKDNKLVNKFNELDLTKYAGLDKQKGTLNFSLAPIGKTVGFPVIGFEDAAGSVRDLVYTIDQVKGINAEGQLEVFSYLVFTPSGDNEIGELIHLYEWKNDSWSLAGIAAKAYNGQLTESASAKVSPGTAAAGGIKNGVMTLEENNLNEVFSLKLDDVLRMCGEPEFREEDYMLQYDSIQYTFDYGGKLGGLMFSTGGDSIFGTKIGMTTQQIKGIMGTPEDEVLDVEGFEGVEKVLVYSISGHEVLMGIAGDRSIWCIVKGNY